MIEKEFKINKEVNNEFLKAYKQFEQTLRNLGLNYGGNPNYVFGYEQSHPEVTEELKICRILRNYLQHNQKSFVQATPEMIKLLEELTYKTLQENQTALNMIVNTENSDRMLFDTDTFADLQKSLSKFDKILIKDSRNSEIIGVCDARSFVKFIQENEPSETDKIGTNFKKPRITKTTPSAKKEKVIDKLRTNDVIEVVSGTEFFGYIF